MAWYNILGSLVSPITDAYKSNQNRKAAKEAGRIGIESQILAGEQEVKMSVEQWQAMALKGNEESFKDELVTIVFVSPIVVIMFGSVYGAITGDMAVVDGMKSSIDILNGIGGQFGEAMIAVVYAAIGIQTVKKVFK